MNKGRRAIVIALLGVLAAIPFIGRKPRQENQTFDFDEIFSKVIDTILPEDESPGALAAGIDQIFLREIRNSHPYFGKVFTMLQRIHRHSINAHGRAFVHMPLEKRELLIQKILAIDAVDQVTRVQLIGLRAKTLTRFYLTPAANQMLDYHPPSQGGYPDYNQPPV